MALLDFRLRDVQQNASLEGRIHVLVRCREGVATLIAPGFQMTSLAGDVMAGSIPADQLDHLEQHPDVVFVEASRPLRDELDVSSVAINLVSGPTLLRTIPSLGQNAIIGIIDSGFDLTHPCFRNSKGKTRIMAAWDQANLSGLSGQTPSDFNYGVEYTREVIDWEAANKRILINKNHKDAGAHGTYVAGIVAGNGKPHGIFAGIAPQAEMILVTYKNDVPIGGSAFVLDAINYILRQARARGRPVVINLSQGDSLGSHDGTSLLERALDTLVNAGGMLMVTSAGNERAGRVSHHAHGNVKAGNDLSLSFTLLGSPFPSPDGDTIELWYHRDDRFAVALKTPSGWTTEFVSPARSKIIVFPTGNRARIYSEISHPNNGENHIGIILEKGEGWTSGAWELILRGEDVKKGDFDAWADRSNGVTVIGFDSHKSEEMTVTLPGNARQVITVGGFVSRLEQEYETTEVRYGLALGSSVGPTRDGRYKPDLNAPSSLVMTPRMRTDLSQLSYDFLSGTSIAAAHVSGVIALLWASWPRLSAGQIRSALYSTAREDRLTGPTPNMSWGRGKLDAQEAYKALSILADKEKLS